MRVSAVDQFRMFCEERSPPVVTAGFPRVSVQVVEFGDPLEHSLSPVNRGGERGEEERIPESDDDDGNGADSRPPGCGVDVD